MICCPTFPFHLPIFTDVFACHLVTNSFSMPLRPHICEGENSNSMLVGESNFFTMKNKSNLFLPPWTGTCQLRILIFLTICICVCVVLNPM